MALAALVLGLLEYYWANHSLNALHSETHADHILAEPGKVVTWSATVENRSRLPILYTCSVILRSGVNMEYFSYSAYFKRALILLTATWAIISIVNYFEDPKNLKEAVIHTDVILQYTQLFFLRGVILQRQLRLGARHSQGGAGQIVGMLGCVGAAIPVILPIFTAKPLFAYLPIFFLFPVVH